MASPSVTIIGGGIAGPVLAIFLKLRGYQPIVYERLPAFVDLGVGLAYVSVNASSATD